MCCDVGRLQRLINIAEVFYGSKFTVDRLSQVDTVQLS